MKEVKKQTKLGLSVTREEDFGKWYRELVVSSGMISYTDISGCYVLHSWSYSIWDSRIKRFLEDEFFEQLGVENEVFPLFVSERALAKEKAHIEGFAPEVAWVTRAGNEELDTGPLAIRPTSETIIYPIFAEKIRSHEDLPLKVNQWCNVVRWEFKHPIPFIRSREFWWQEGHTAFATQKEADEEVLEVLEIYRRVYEELLAVPVIKGVKSEAEKFAGGLRTTTVEAFVPITGRGIQAATSHSLGQNFAEIFGIEFEDRGGEVKKVWQNSWGLSTRSIGVMIMVHGDNKGLVLPPRVARLQVVIIPVPYKGVETAELLGAADKAARELNQAGIRVQKDTSSKNTPGWKYAHWELKGVPLRIEIGPRDLEKNQVRVVRRDTGGKEDVPMEKLLERVKQLLEEIQLQMLEKARRERDECIVRASTWEEFIQGIKDKKMVLAPWCDEKEVEEEVKLRTKMGETGTVKTLCQPFDQPDLREGTKCFASGKLATRWGLWGRSY